MSKKSKKKGDTDRRWLVNVAVRNRKQAEAKNTHAWGEEPDECFLAKIPKQGDHVRDEEGDRWLKIEHVFQLIDSEEDEPVALIYATKVDPPVAIDDALEEAIKPSPPKR